MKTIQTIVHAFLLILALVAGFTIAGCDNKETILDVDTPNGGVKIERDRDDGSVTIDVDE